MANNPQQEMITSTTTTARGDEAVTYEEMSNVCGNEPNASISDTLVESQLGTDEDEASQMTTTYLIIIICWINSI